MSSFNLIGIQDAGRWNDVVTSFAQHDVYYLSDYVKAFRIHGDGEPFLLHYQGERLKGIIVVMRRDLAQFAPFRNKLEPGHYFDVVTPYGYGGFLLEGETTPENMKRFYEQYCLFAREHRVISACVRYHPQLSNADAMRMVSNVQDLGKTIAMDLESEEVIWANMTRESRNRTRKAINSGIEIRHGKDPELMEAFIRIYNRTMNKNRADSYYYFERPFYESILNDLKDHFEIFYAVLDQKIIAISIMLYANHRMHSHLVGSLSEYRNLAPSNLLFVEAACWGISQGIHTLHLGGGFGSKEDELFRFKKSFNTHSDHIFSIGKEVFDQELYNRLVQYRKNADACFDCDSSFFPLYRAL